VGHLPNDVHVVEGDLYDHVATPRDSDDANPFRRMDWRRVESGWPKVACRLRPMTSFVVNAPIP